MAKKMHGGAMLMHQADRSNLPLRRLMLILSASQPPRIKPMAPTAPTAKDDTTLASRTLIPWKRCRNAELKEPKAYILKLWKMPERMIHHMVGRPRTARYGAHTDPLDLVTTRPGSIPPRSGSRMISARSANSNPGTHAI